MTEGYYAEPNDDPYAGLDELLCEYVDGTMDRAAREAFEEYLCANPALAEHVQCLCQTRRLLCHYDCLPAPRGFQVRLRRRLAHEMLRMEAPALTPWVAHLGAFATWTSVMVVMMILGMLAGATLVSENRALESSSPHAERTLVNRSPVAARAFRSALYNRSHPSVYGPPSTLPALSPTGQMTWMYPVLPDTFRRTSRLQRTGAIP